MLAGIETRSKAAGEQVGEVALCELCTNIGAVSSLLEQMRVRIESHARARVTEDAADLNDVEANVDDQMAGEGVAQIVEMHPPTVTIQTRIHGGATKHPLGDVVVQERGATRGCEYIIGAARETGAAFVLAENRGELGEKRDLADGGARLWLDAVRGDATAAARELADVDDAGDEVDVGPAQAQHLGEPHAVYAPVTRSGRYRRGQAPKRRTSSVPVSTRWSERSGCGRSSRSSRWNGCVAT